MATSDSELFMANALAGIARGINNGLKVRRQRFQQDRSFQLEKRRLDIAERRVNAQIEKDKDPLAREKLQLEQDRLKLNTRKQKAAEVAEVAGRGTEKIKAENILKQLQFDSDELDFKFAQLEDKDSARKSKKDLDNRIQELNDLKQTDLRAKNKADNLIDKGELANKVRKTDLEISKLKQQRDQFESKQEGVTLKSLLDKQDAQLEREKFKHKQNQDKIETAVDLQKFEQEERRIKISEEGMSLKFQEAGIKRQESATREARAASELGLKKEQFEEKKRATGVQEQFKTLETIRAEKEFGLKGKKLEADIKGTEASTVLKGEQLRQSQQEFGLKQKKEIREQEKFEEDKRAKGVAEGFKEREVVVKEREKKDRDNAKKLLGPVAGRQLGDKVSAKLSVDQLGDLLRDPRMQKSMGALQGRFETGPEGFPFLSLKVLQSLNPDQRAAAGKLMAKITIVTKSAIKAQEGSRISDADFRIMKDVMASINDEPSVALEKLEAFEEEINNSIRGTLFQAQARGKDISAFSGLLESIGGPIEFGVKASKKRKPKKPSRSSQIKRLQRIISKPGQTQVMKVRAQRQLERLRR